MSKSKLTWGNPATTTTAEQFEAGIDALTTRFTLSGDYLNAVSGAMETVVSAYCRREIGFRFMEEMIGRLQALHNIVVLDSGISYSECDCGLFHPLSEAGENND